jgi:AraC-like DNA-binding protein
MTAAANRGFVDLRTSPAVRAGAWSWDGPDVVTGWHHHPYHQVEYALSGVAEVETPNGRFLLPPQQAIWIPAGLRHNTTLRGVRSVSVFFDPATMPGDDAGSSAADWSRARVLAAAPVIREMISYGVRWSIARPPDGDGTADVFFDALARLVIEWLDDEVPLHLPTSTDPVIRDVMAHTNDHLATVTMVSACRAVGTSPRTLRRRFVAETGMTWQEYVIQARLLRAMALLAGSERTVLGIGTDVGFDSPSGFTRAFRKLTGQSPSLYRRRLRPGRTP